MLLSFLRNLSFLSKFDVSEWKIDLQQWKISMWKLHDYSIVITCHRVVYLLCKDVIWHWLGFLLFAKHWSVHKISSDHTQSKERGQYFYLCLIVESLPLTGRTKGSFRAFHISHFWQGYFSHYCAPFKIFTILIIELLCDPQDFFIPLKKHLLVCIVITALQESSWMQLSMHCYRANAASGEITT